MTSPEEPEHDTDELRHDKDLVDHLTLLGRALGNPIRVRIAAALLRVDEAGPKDLTPLVDDTLGNVSYHVRYLNDLGFLKLQRLIPRRGAVEHKYSLEEPLRRALPAAALALGRDTDAKPTDPPSDSELLSLSYFLARSQVGEVIASDRHILVRIGEALSDERRIEILGYLLRHDHATPTQIAEGLRTHPTTVSQHLSTLADNHMVTRKPTPTLRGHWTVTPPTKKALAGLYDLLVQVRRGSATAEPVGEDQPGAPDPPEDRAP